MTVLVTGATGFIGSRLARRLAGAGHAVRILTRGADAEPRLSGCPIEVVQGDVADPESVERAVQGVEALYHLAGAFQGVKSSGEYRRVNVEGTRHVVEAALRHGVKRFVHCSTSGVHGPSLNGPIAEDAPFRHAPWNLYEATKAEGERLVMRAAHEQGLPASVARPGIVYGPGDRRLLKLFRTIAKGKFLMLGDGRPTYHLAYVDDVVDGMLLCGSRPEAVGEAFLLAGEECPTVGEVVALIARAVGAPLPAWRVPAGPVYAAGYLCELACRPLGLEPPLSRRRVEFFTKSRSFDIGKAKRRLGYAPLVGPEEGIRRTVRWYQEQGWLNG